jgi:putative Mg2+ transporter-C (MgtC) family protein
MDGYVITATPAILALAFLLGALIGLEREWFSHACGIRPCVLVCLGAAAFGDLIVTRVPEANWGNAFGAIVTGIGFLGAGAILKPDRRREVHGMSTAATIWAVAICGLLIGAGEFVAGILLAIAVLLVNVLLRPLARWVAKRSAHHRTPDDVMDG